MTTVNIQLYFPNEADKKAFIKLCNKGRDKVAERRTSWTPNGSGRSLSAYIKYCTFVTTMALERRKKLDLEFIDNFENEEKLNF